MRTIGLQHVSQVRLRAVVRMVGIRQHDRFVGGVARTHSSEAAQ